MMFSVLIPVYNAEKYLVQCVDSVFRQEIKNFEIILVDDGSTDESGKICDWYMERYPEFIRVLHKANEGCLRARRDAISLAKGDYLIFCDADDYYTDKAFLILSELINKYSPDIILYNLELVNDKGICGRMNQHNIFSDEELVESKEKIYENLLSSSFICSSMSMKCVRREYGWEKREFKEYTHLNYGEDLLQSLEIFTKAERIIYCDKEIYCYRIGSGMTGEFSFKFYKDFKTVFEEIRQYESKWNLENFSNQISYFYLYLVYSTIRQLSKSNIKKDEAVQYLHYLWEEKEFQESYSKYFSSNEKRESIKMRISLWLLKYNHVRGLYLLISLVRKVNFTI